MPLEMRAKIGRIERHSIEQQKKKWSQPMIASETEHLGEIYQLAVSKMSAVLGRVRTDQLLRPILEEHRIELRTPQELFEFSEVLSKMSGFEGTVGAMLGVTAVLRGATPMHQPRTKHPVGRNSNDQGTVVGKTIP